MEYDSRYSRGIAIHSRGHRGLDNHRDGGYRRVGTRRWSGKLPPTGKCDGERGTASGIRWKEGGLRSTDVRLRLVLQLVHAF